MSLPDVVADDGMLNQTVVVINIYRRNCSSRFFEEGNPLLCQAKNVFRSCNHRISRKCAPNSGFMNGSKGENSILMYREEVGDIDFYFPPLTL
jgi:hypothetical protein